MRESIALEEIGRLKEFFIKIGLHITLKKLKRDNLLCLYKK